MTHTTMMWFRRDLRLADNAALTSALSLGDSVACVASRRPPEAGAEAPGAASGAWRDASLAALDAALRERSGGANGLAAVFEDPAPHALTHLARACDATRVCCTRVWTPAGLAEEDAARAALAGAGIALEVSEGSLLVTPEAMHTSEGGAFKVFTPFHNAWERAWPPGRATPAPNRIQGAPAGLPVPRFSLVPRPQPPAGMELGALVAPGEAGAHARLSAFVRDNLGCYERDHDVPSVSGTSRLSMALAHGELSPRQIATAVYDADADIPEEPRSAFLRQLAWREFAAAILHASPTLPTSAWRPQFDSMPWIADPDAFAAWCDGRTGVPFVDAGMRELRATGWMHNRVRMVVGSFLTKDLLIDWREGQAWFAQRLADADIAQNAFNWQWVAGSGADAAPYFRIFNPVLQAERFDPHGTYVRRWVPELAALPDRLIHHPWDASEEDLAKAGISLGESYPERLINHADARIRALAAFRDTNRRG